MVMEGYGENVVAWKNNLDLMDVIVQLDFFVNIRNKLRKLVTRKNWINCVI